MANKVLLFFPSYRSLEAAPPLALLALAAVLEDKGYAVEVVDSTVDPGYLDRILDQLDDALLLGISIVTGPMIDEAVEVAKAVKIARPDLPIVLGGWHPSTLARETLGAPYVDVVVRGQGEVTLGEIVDRVAAGRGLDGVAGCSFRTPGGAVVDNPPRPTVNIDSLPAKAYHLVDLEPYAALCGRRWVMYTSSHGCPYDCSFCSNASLYGRAWNALPADRVVREVVDLVRRYRLDMVDIVDDNFLVDSQRGVDIARGFLAEGEKFEWTIQSTANFLLRMPDHDVRTLARSGLGRVFIGAESGSDEVLESINKVRFQDTDVLSRVAEKLERAGITGTFSLIFGLPAETAAQRRRTLELIGRIKKQHPRMEFHSNIYTPYPGAPNFSQALSLGLEAPRSLEEWAAFYPKLQRLPWIDAASHKQIQRMREYIRIGFGAAPIRRRSRVRGALVRVLGPSARARLRGDRYAIPVELWLLRAGSAVKSALNPWGSRSHVIQS